MLKLVTLYTSENYKYRDDGKPKYGDSEFFITVDFCQENTYILTETNPSTSSQITLKINRTSFELFIQNYIDWLHGCADYNGPALRHFSPYAWFKEESLWAHEIK